MSFEAARLEELPPWLDDAVGQAFAGAHGRMLDAEQAKLTGGVLAAWLPDAPDDALDAIGRGFDILRFSGEANDLYRARLEVAWPTWNEAGTAQAILDSLHNYGITDVAVYEEET